MPQTQSGTKQVMTPKYKLKYPSIDCKCMFLFFRERQWGIQRNWQGCHFTQTKRRGGKYVKGRYGISRVGKSTSMLTLFESRYTKQPTCKRFSLLHGIINLTPLQAFHRHPAECNNMQQEKSVQACSMQQDPSPRTMILLFYIEGNNICCILLHWAWLGWENSENTFWFDVCTEFKKVLKLEIIPLFIKVASLHTSLA